MMISNKVPVIFVREWYAMDEWLKNGFEIDTIYSDKIELISL